VNTTPVLNTPSDQTATAFSVSQKHAEGEHREQVGEERERELRRCHRDRAAARSPPGLAAW
jgi:hypothetical protein